MLARERTCYLCPSLLDRWHLQCAAGLELVGDGGPGGHTLRSLIGLWSHALNLPGWVCFARCSGNRLVCTTAELSASCLVPMAMCLSPFPVLLRIGLLVRLYCCVACLLAERHLSIPELLRRLALAVRYGALGARSALSALRLI